MIIHCEYCHRSLLRDVSAFHDVIRKRKLEALHFEFSLSLPHSPLPWPDFHLYPFAIINHNHEHPSKRLNLEDDLSDSPGISTDVTMEGHLGKP